jgi:hypothetical protein
MEVELDIRFGDPETKLAGSWPVRPRILILLGPWLVLLELKS